VYLGALARSFRRKLNHGAGPCRDTCVQCFKRELIRSALRMHSGNKLRAAQELKISRCYLHRLLNQLNVQEQDTLEEALPVPEVKGSLREAVKVSSQVA